MHTVELTSEQLIEMLAASMRASAMVDNDDILRERRNPRRCGILRSIRSHAVPLKDCADL